MQENIMGTKSMTPLLFSMALPIMLSMLIQSLYNVVDSIFVAQLGEDALAAVSLAFPVQQLMIAVSVGTSVGVNAIVSRRLGQRDQEGAERAANSGILLMVISWLAFALTGFFGADLFFSIFTQNAQVAEMGAMYLRICMVFGIGQFVEICMERLVQATGRSIYQMYSQITGALTNIILDPIFIFGMFGAPKMGVMGAAAATVLGQAAGGLLSTFLNIRFNHELKFSAKKLRLHGESVKAIYQIGVPCIITQSISSVMNFGMNKILADFGEIAVSVMGVYFKLQSFIFMPCYGINNALVPIVSYNYGAGQRERVLQGIRKGIVMVSVVMAAGTAAFWIFPSGLLKLFGDSEELIMAGKPALQIISLGFLPAGISLVNTALFQGIGRASYSLWVNVVRQILVLLPLAWIFSRTGTLSVVWWAFLAAELIGVAGSLLACRHVTAQFLK